MANKFRPLKKIFITTILLILLYTPVALAAGNSYLGTDDLVDKKMQEVAGLKAKPPLIDISKGNLGLFAFGLGGFTAGILVGYNWRKLFVEKAGK